MSLQLAETSWIWLPFPSLHVASWYVHRPQSYDVAKPLRPMYALYSYLYMEPLGSGSWHTVALGILS